MQFTAMSSERSQHPTLVKKGRGRLLLFASSYDSTYYHSGERRGGDHDRQKIVPIYKMLLGFVNKEHI